METIKARITELENEVIRRKAELSLIDAEYLKKRREREIRDVVELLQFNQTLLKRIGGEHE
jgi:hypothetical protein